MDVIASVKFYLNKMVEECGVGLKVLVMDKETVSDRQRSTTNLTSIKLTIKLVP